MLLGQARRQLVRLGLELGMVEPSAVGEALLAEDSANGEESEIIARLPISRQFVLTRDDEDRLIMFMVIRDGRPKPGRTALGWIQPDCAAVRYGTSGFR